MGNLARFPVVNLKPWGPVHEGTQSDLESGSGGSVCDLVGTFKPWTEGSRVFDFDVHMGRFVREGDIQWIDNC